MSEGVCICTHEAPAHWPLAPTSCSYPYCECGEYRPETSEDPRSQLPDLCYQVGKGRRPGRVAERVLLVAILVLLALSVLLWIGTLGR